MTAFLIAQISDLHFGLRHNRFNPIDAITTSLREKAAVALSEVIRQPLKAGSTFYPSTFEKDVAASLLWALHEDLPRLDGLVVTGDLATTGGDADLKVATDYFSGLVPADWDVGPAPLPSLIKNERDIIVSLPGNHDRYEGTALLPGGGAFERHLGPCWDFDRAKSYDLISVEGKSRVKACTIVKDRAAIAIVMADFSLDTAGGGLGLFGYIGQGRVSRTVLGHLLETTEIVRAEARNAELDLGLVWALHFPPCYPGISNSLRLLDDNELSNPAIESGVSVILAGHTHEALSYDIRVGDGRVPVVCCGATTGLSSHGIYSYSIIRIDVPEGGGTSNVKASNIVWNSSEGLFVRQPQFPFLL
jgi:3',5'-cyclic AMP phosphodiesterase CpdA